MDTILKPDAVERRAGAASPEPVEIPKGSTLGDRVNAAIRGFLIDGEIAPGEKLPLRKLADSLGVSVMPVRSAVARLQSDGVLEVAPGRSVRVPVMTNEQFRELMAIRMEIEGFAAEQAATVATEQDLRGIAELEASFQLLGHRRPFRTSAAVRANKDFHFAIYRASKMSALVDIIERLWLRAGPVLFYLHKTSGESATRDAGMMHKRALQALFARDGKAAREAIAEDIRLAGVNLLDSNSFRAP